MWNRKLSTTILALSCICLVSLTSINSHSYFTDSSSKTNFFTVADVDIVLDEPNYNALVDSNSDSVKDVSTNMVQGKVIKTDPKVINQSTLGVYAIMSVDIPVKDVVTVSSAPSTKVSTELFTYTVNSGWTLKSEKSYTGYVRRIYTYDSVVPVGTSTISLMDTVTYANVVEGQITDKLSIPIKAYAIQQNGFSNITDAYNSFDWGE